MATVTKRVPGLVHKGGRYYFRLRIPQDLVDAFGKAEVSEALGDVSRSAAERAVRERARHWGAEFERRRGQGAAAVSTEGMRAASMEDVRHIAREDAQRLLQHDDVARALGSRSDAWEQWTDTLSDFDHEARLGVSGEYLNASLQRFREALKRRDLVPPADVDTARVLHREWVVLQAQALEGIAARTKGKPVPTPDPVGPLPVRRVLRDAFEVWKDARLRPVKTVEAFGRHLALFETLTGNPPLATLGKPGALQFRAALQAWAVEKKRTARTADNVLTSVKSIAGAAVEQGWLASNVFDRLAVKAGGKRTEAREPWKPAELPVLFNAPLFTAYALPTGGALAKKAGGAAAYWVPLLALFTGARVSELCQLWTDDLSEEGEVLVLEFRENEARQQGLKGASFWRAVPVHAELLRLGFRDYWRSATGAVPGRLFPSLPAPDKNGAGGQFAQWFGSFKVAQGFASPTKTFHSFRHTVVTELTFAGQNLSLVDAITGHSGSGTGARVYGATVRRNAVRMVPVIESLTYPALNLPRVFPVP